MKDFDDWYYDFCERISIMCEDGYQFETTAKDKAWKEISKEMQDQDTPNRINILIKIKTKAVEEGVLNKY